MRIDAVLFDMGGTLLGYENREKLGGAFVQALAELGLDSTDPAVIAARKQAAQEVEARFAMLRSFIHRDLFRERVARTAEILGVTASKEILDRFYSNQRKAVVNFLSPMPGVHDMLRSLRERGLYLAVVSNADDDYMEPALARHGLTELLDDWTSSEEAKSCKPDDAIFSYALKKAERDAGSTLFVGDSPQHDVAGAHRAGMRTALIGDPGVVAPLSEGLVGQDPDWHIRSLMELVPIVDAS